MVLCNHWQAFHSIKIHRLSEQVYIPVLSSYLLSLRFKFIVIIWGMNSFTFVTRLNIPFLAKKIRKKYQKSQDTWLKQLVHTYEAHVCRNNVRMRMGLFLIIEPLRILFTLHCTACLLHVYMSNSLLSYWVALHQTEITEKWLLLPSLSKTNKFGSSKVEWLTMHVGCALIKTNST